MLVTSPRELTESEVLLIVRRRAGRTQREQAMHLHVSLYWYQGAEVWRACRETLQGLKIRRPSKLTDAERCVIARRRLKMSLGEIARHLDLSTYWVGEMERGAAPCQRLVEYWTTP